MNLAKRYSRHLAAQLMRRLQAIHGMPSIQPLGIISGSTRTKTFTMQIGKLLVIENVPIMTCQQCGESYLTAETLHEIARIKLHRQSFAGPVAVAGFSIPPALLSRNIHSNAQQASV